jgi:hypothetical protein
MSDAMLPRNGRTVRRDGGEPAPTGYLNAVATRGARGAIVIALAVIAGVVLLQVVDKGNTGPVGDQSAKAAVTTTTTTKAGTSTSSTTATTAAQGVRPASQITVQVLNGSGKSGAAGALTVQLRAKGYQTLDAKDTTKRTGTVVYYQPGFDRDAAALVAQIPGSPRLAPLPTPPPTNAAPNANIVIVIGA